jgi:hypothetical protein
MTFKPTAEREVQVHPMKLFHSESNELRIRAVLTVHTSSISLI